MCSSVYENYEKLESDFKEGNLHPGDLKPALAEALNALIEPVRQHFKDDANAKKLLHEVRQFTVTR